VTPRDTAERSDKTLEQLAQLAALERTLAGVTDSPKRCRPSPFASPMNKQSTQKKARADALVDE
jgi:hypothetical protein